MKQTIRTVITITEALAALLLVAASCKKAEIEPGPTPVPVDKGADVVFRSAIGGSESGTKTAYANDHVAGSATAESIFWQAGDNVRVWCRECSEPNTDSYGGADHWADYTVTPDTESGSKGTIIARTGTVGLRWSEAEPMPTHYFYAVSPSPVSSGKTGENWNLGATQTSTATPFTFTGVIPAEQTISGSLTTGEDPSDNTKNLTVATPDMNNLYMVAKKDVAPESETKDGETNTVFLSFRPISTAIQFTIENAMTAEGAKMQVESVKIMSDPKTGTPTNISGAFEANLSGTWTKPKIASVPAESGIISEYINDYPSCAEPAGALDQSSAITIDFKNTTAYTEGIAKGGRLQFTFFLLPTQSVNDLSFVITRKDGDGTKTIKTRLAMADGNGIPFPVHKKTYVKGILVPDSAQWTIQYTVDVTKWDDTHSEELPFDYPAVKEITTVTPWENVASDLDLERNAPKAVDLGLPGGVEWGTCNLGANNPWEYGNYYMYGNTAPIHKPIDYSGLTIQDGKYNVVFEFYDNPEDLPDYTPERYPNKSQMDLSKGFSWCNCPFTDGIPEEDKPGTLTNYNIFTKYTGSQSEYSKSGTPDGKTTLDPEDDAATALLGGSWRMPSESEVNDLIHNCYWVHVSSYKGVPVNGVLVYKAKDESHKGKYDTGYNGMGAITALYNPETDAHIFFPCTGCSTEDGLSLTNNSDRFIYRYNEVSSSSYNGKYYYFIRMQGDNYKPKTNSYYRRNGYAIRPVRDTEGN